MQSGDDGGRAGGEPLLPAPTVAQPPRKKKPKKRKVRSVLLFTVTLSFRFGFCEFNMIILPHYAGWIRSLRSFCPFPSLVDVQEKPSSAAVAGGGSDDVPRGKPANMSAALTSQNTGAGSINPGVASTSNSHGTSSNQGNINKKNRKHGRRQQPTAGAASGNSTSRAGGVNNGNDQGTALDAAQKAVNDQMRRALEEDQYSAIGSIVDGADSEEEDLFLYRGQPVRLDRSAMMQTAKKMSLYYWYPYQQGGKKNRQLIRPDFMSKVMNGGDDYDDPDADDKDDDEDMDGGYDHGGNASSSKDSGRSKKKRKKELGGPSLHLGGVSATDMTSSTSASGLANGGGGSTCPVVPNSQNRDTTTDFLDPEEDLDRDGGSIFGQTTGATNSTWVQCDKCKKWRRLRGVVDEKKLPTKWFCSMNRNDPERARCSAPEEDYDAQQTPESAADARTRKHLRVWVRRLQCQEAYEARQPTLTRGKKRAAASSMKVAYEWVRCCNPSCGKWRAVLRFMDAKSSVLDRVASSSSGKKEWYCVMNTWDEKIASCAAPQENLPAVGCPPWVLQDEDNKD